MAEQFSKMYDLEVVGGDQRTRLAEMLRANMLNQPQGQMVSGWYVKPNWMQQLAPALGGIIGTQMGKDIEEEKRKSMQADYEKFMGSQQPSPQQLGAAVRASGQPSDQAIERAYPSSPAAGQMQDGEFRAMKTGGVQGMPNYNIAPQPAQQPAPQQFDRYNPSNYSNPQFQSALMQRNMQQAFSVPKYGTTPVRTDKGYFLVSETGQSRQLTDEAGKPLNQPVDYNDLVITGPDGKPMINPLAMQAKQAVARSGAANVSVNTGQKGFDNTLKLRSDFRSEPTYKAFQEVQSAWDKVRTSSERATPASDLATATKFMKILDEGSVVRESELGLALAATGVEDKLKNYANNILTGQKLNPAQRKDFRETAQMFYNEAAKRYNGKRGEYADIAGRNQLNVEDVVGPEVKLPKQVVRTGKDKSGRVVYQYSDGTTGYGN